ncbi:hypothetical protein HWC29_gp012 [Aeromonas phage 4_4572]|nr:hypothetical protein HWC29_gp012 [Aeromonas phage 4_4572]QEG09010.1 hypothetical protein [Aeromonas phage 4_4572]
MALMKYIHRDKLQRVIRVGDYVVWGNGKYGKGLEIAKVVGATPIRIQIFNMEKNKTTYAFPDNLVVISQQVQANIEGNVGANMDLEEMRQGDN